MPTMANMKKSGSVSSSRAEGQVVSIYTVRSDSCSQLAYQTISWMVDSLFASVVRISTKGAVGSGIDDTVSEHLTPLNRG